MTAPAMTLTPRSDDGLGAGALPGTTELLSRIGQDRYADWLTHTAAAQGCSHPVRLRGEITDIDPATGEIIRRAATGTMPDNVIYTPCGTRRASVCPACAETYRRDAYQIVKAGLDGGKGIPADVAAHPAIFATFTAPSFGHVHTRATGPGGKVLRCRPRRKKTICPHGRH
ncbi:MAG: replication initiator, partial [Mycobacterium sp.]